MKSLEQKLQERIKNDIGDLITDEDLQEMIKQGINKALFEQREEKNTSTWGSRTKVKPCLIDEIVENNFNDRMREAIDKYLQDNPKIVQKKIEEAIQKGVGDALIKALDQRFAGIFMRGIEEMKIQGYLPENPQQNY